MGGAEPLNANLQGSSGPGELTSGAEDHLFGWSHGLKLCQHPFYLLRSCFPSWGLRFPSLVLGGTQRALIPGSTRNMELLVFPARKGLMGTSVFILP